MKEENIERVTNELDTWQYLNELPDSLYGFTLDKSRNIDGNVYDFFSYTNKEARKSATAYYHEETNEYKLRVKIGLTEFCRIEFIAPSLSVFETLLKKQFSDMVKDFGTFNLDKVSILLRDKHIIDWDYGKRLPEKLEGFSLFIHPSEPFHMTNGSYIVFDYCDFVIESNFIIYYNVLRDEFYGEARIRNIPDMTYDFDSNTLSELEGRLDEHLVHRLQEIRKRATM
ncbi:MAG: hypothetical protein PUI81_09640 [Veillonellaceae bacterium]|nr:hypothetical protein [Veillonellaceae bacterium]MDD6924346.1 hypothetical protein [Veillonellaceae bacterium]